MTVARTRAARSRPFLCLFVVCGLAGCAGKGAAPAASAGGGGTGGAAGNLADQSVLERNHHPSRDGHFIQPTLTWQNAGRMARDAGFAASFAGNMWASPLYLEDGPGGKGVFFAVTTGNDVYALDEVTGAVVWTRNIGSSPTATGVGCGGISPLGIISTPVIDAQSRTIYLAGAIGTTSIARHEIHALSVDDGSERAGWPVDVSQLAAPMAGGGSLAFAPSAHNQRSALSLVGGIVYVAYGGHVGDCGPYHGWVVAVDTRDPTMRGAWASGGQGEGIWAAGGMASDGTGVFATTGNHTPANQDATRVDSEEVIRLTGLASLDRSSKNLYTPTSWSTMDAADADFGAINPLYVQVEGATPSTLVAALSKDGHLYLLDSTNLGGMGGHLVDFMVSAGSMSIHTVPGTYTTAAGTHVILSTDSGALCPSGMPNGEVVMSVLLEPGAPPIPRVLWCAILVSSDPTSRSGLSGPTAPIATTTDGRAQPIVWFVSGGKLTGVDGETGLVIYDGGTDADACSNVRQWTSPIAVKGRIIAGGDGHLCSWSPH
jgi:hypothetical protein